MTAQGTNDGIQSQILRLRETIASYRRDGMAFEAAVLEQWVFELMRCRADQPAPWDGEPSWGQ